MTSLQVGQLLFVSVSDSTYLYYLKEKTASNHVFVSLGKNNMLSLPVFRILMVPMVSCRGKTSNQNFSTLSGPALAVLQPTVLMSRTSSRPELQRPTVTQQHLLTTLFRSMAMKAEDHWLGH